MIGTALADCGIDLDLGPVADVNSNPDNPVIGTRSFGADPSHVAKHVVAWVDGLQSAGVAACLKHFPGHGDTAHRQPPRAAQDRVAARRPRRRASWCRSRRPIAAGAASVMTSHIVVDALDADLPATLSPRVLAHLRDVLGFDGVIVSDALDMAGASAVRGIPEAAVLSLIAGADLLCIGAGQGRGAGALGPGGDRRRRSPPAGSTRQRLSEAVRRIEAMPRGGGRASPYDLEVQLAGARAALRIEGDLPDLTGAAARARRDRAQHRRRGRALGAARSDVVAAGFTDRSTRGRPGPRRPSSPGDVSLLAELADAGPVVLVDYGWPGPLPVAVPRVVTHGARSPRTPWSRSCCAREDGVRDRHRHRRDQGPRGRPRRRRLDRRAGAPPHRARSRRRAAHGRPGGRRAGLLRSDPTRWSVSACPDVVDPLRGEVSHAVNLGIDGVPLALAERLGEVSGRRVVVENDVNVAALGVAALTGSGDLAYLGVGTGLAAGIVLGGRLRRGARGVAGEIGHVSVDPAGVLCGCGQRGCLETHRLRLGAGPRCGPARILRASGRCWRRWAPGDAARRRSSGTRSSTASRRP